jgi:hypothetical protein
MQRIEVEINIGLTYAFLQQTSMHSQMVDKMQFKSLTLISFLTAETHSFLRAQISHSFKVSFEHSLVFFRELELLFS